MTGENILNLGTENWAISPTGLSTFIDYGEEGFLKKYVLGEAFAQSYPMAVGTVFDCLIKSVVVGCEVDYSGLEVQGEVRDKAIIEGRRVLDAYLVSDAWRRLNELITLADEVCVEVDTKRPVESKFGTFWVRMKVDLALRFGIEWLCFDWKVNGAASEAKPAAGYIGHKDFIGDRCPLGVEWGIRGLKKDWHRQVALYTMGLNGCVEENVRGGIEQLTFDGTKWNAWTHRSWIRTERTVEEVVKMMSWRPSGSKIDALKKMKDLL